MANIEEAVKRLSIEADEKGVDEVTDKLKDLTKAHGDLAVASETTEKASLSLGTKFEQLERKFVEGLKAQQDYAKVQNQVNAAVAQNPALQDRANAVLEGAKKKYDEATTGSSVFSRALGGVQSQMVALSAGAGPVGTFLAGFGPAGLAAAAAVGAVSKSLDYMSEAADRLASKAQSLQAMSVVTRLSTNDLQILQNVASNFGSSGQQVGQFVDRYTQQLTELRNATGPLYDMIRKIDPAIAQQMLTARDTATEIQLLAQAYAKAGDDGNKLLTLAGGRGASSQAPLISALGDAGSIEQLGKSMGVVISLTGQQVDELSKLKAESEDVGSRVKDNIASIFATPVLQNQVNARKEMEQLTIAVKNFSLSDAWKAFVDSVARLGDEGGHAATNVSAISNIVANSPKMPTFGPASITYSAGEAPSITANLNIEKERIQYLGSAATAQERLNLQIQQYGVLLADGTIKQDTYNRAVAAAKTDSSLQLESQRLGLLGDLATSTERLTDETNRINVARARGLQLTDTEVDAIKRSSEARLEGGKLYQNATLGIATAADIAAQKQREFQDAIDHGAKSAEQQAAALAVLDKKFEGITERSAQAGAQLPGLAQLEQQAGSLRGNLDTLGTGITNDVANPLVDMASGAKTAKDAFADMGTGVARSLAQMAINMAVTKTIAEGLQMALGAFLPAGGVTYGVSASGNPTINGPATNFGAGQGHTGAADIGSVAATRFIHPAYFENAPRHHTGTDRLGYDEVPFIGKKGEEIGWPDQLAKKYGGGGTNVTMKVNIVNSAPGVQVDQQQSDDGMSLDVVIKPLEDAMAGRAARGKGSLAKTNRAISSNGNLRG